MLALFWPRRSHSPFSNMRVSGDPGDCGNPEPPVPTTFGHQFTVYPAAHVQCGCSVTRVLLTLEPPGLTTCVTSFYCCPRLMWELSVANPVVFIPTLILSTLTELVPHSEYFAKIWILPFGNFIFCFLPNHATHAPSLYEFNFSVHSFYTLPTS